MANLAQKPLWKTEKLRRRHLRIRINAGHLPADATLEDYESIIRRVAGKPDSLAYVYLHNGQLDKAYAVATLLIGQQPWLIMASWDSILETAFVIDKEGYLEKLNYIPLGRLGDLGP